MKTEQILQLVEAVSGFGLDEFEYEEDGVKLKLKKGGNVCTSVSAETAGRTVFMKEGYSEEFAPDINKKVWKAAKKIGNGKTFMDGNGGFVTDDHLFINRLARIKTIDIIPYNQEGDFTPTWHTVNDNMEHIDKNTLKAVGQTVLEVIYNEK